MLPAFRSLLLVGTGLGVLAAADPLDREVQKVQDEVARLARQRDDDLARERARTTTALTAIARAQMKSGDLAGAKDAWKGVLSLERTHDEARKFFTAIGQLDAVLAELAAEESPLLPGQEPKARAADAVVLTVPGRPGSAAIPGAPFKAGTVIEVRYQDGTWTCGEGAAASPDDPACPSVSRIKLHAKATSSRSEAGLGYVPAGSAATPFRFTLASDQAELHLAINAGGLASTKGSGEVRYQVRVLAPDAEASKAKR